MNVSDSERIVATLKKQGYKPAKNEAQADLIVINACSVRQSAMHRVYAQINKFYKNKKIILAGCVLESDKRKLKDKISDFWHPNKYFRCNDLPLLDRERVGVRSIYVPIMTGCNNFCSYCVVPYTRGREKSRPIKEIIKEIEKLVENGHKEIMLLGQNVNSYCDNGIARESARRRRLSSATPIYINFPKLLRLINNIPGNFAIKFMTSHPKDMSAELISAIAKCEKVSKEIHLPIQSGDNKILRKMNRKYTVAHYKNLIKKIRAKIPNASISTDIIVGFPGETKKQFQNTVKLCKEIKFSIAYISKYSPRFGTIAYKFKDNVPPAEKKRRWKVLNTLVNKK
ncbi:MAG: (Dimethylallyl)adenosine tRNA methylthiotransferase MiaB [Parcubacteria group bacterium GW2011_GWF2_39_13b]|nr:MAG: (Dimethylallyl)adenosine tRNA methylthiotransferase MiaB [Parcubacteria group bacterium GW2011_GWF2_39_13b]